jgi:hypothetical protein
VELRGVPHTGGKTVKIITWVGGGTTASHGCLLGAV